MNGQNLAYKTNKDIIYARGTAVLIDFLFLGIIILSLCTNTNTISVYPVLAYIFYFSAFETILGFTPGKFFMKIRVISKECNKPKVYQSLIRSLFGLFEINPITFIFLIVTYYLAINSKFKQRLGDKVAGTFVVYNNELKEFINDAVGNSMNLDDFIDYCDTFKFSLKQGSNKVEYINYGGKRLKIKGIGNMSLEGVMGEINNGGRFVLFYECISIIVISQKLPSNIYFVKAGEKTLKYHLKYTLVTLLLGWWGFPWGIIWTIGCVNTNLSGGVDVSQDVMVALGTSIELESKKQDMIEEQKRYSNNVDTLRDNLVHMSGYEFKINYWNKITNFKPEAIEVIKKEFEKRKDENPNFENYIPVNVDEYERSGNWFDSTQDKRTPINKKDNRSIISIVIAVLFIFIFIFLTGIIAGQDYGEMQKTEFDQANYIKSIEYSEKVLKNKPNDIKALLYKSNSLYALNKYEDAIVIYKELENLDPNNKDMFLNMGACNYELGKYYEALRCLEKAIELDPKFSDAYIGKARVMNSLNDYDKAIDIAGQLLKFDSYNCGALDVKGISYMYKGQDSKALELFEKAIKIKPNYLQAYLDKMEIICSQKKYNDCIKFCEESLKIFPHDEDILWYLGDCYSYKEDHNNAIKYYNDTLKVNPKNDRVIISVGWEYYYLQEYKKATEFAEKTLVVNTESESALQLKKEVEEARKPESERIANFVKNNYLYINKVENLNSLADEFALKGEVKADEIQKFIDSFKYKDDLFTFLVSGEYYDEFINDDKNNHITFQSLDKNTEYLRINSFTSGLANEFRNIVDKMDDTENKILILDLRDNPGGLANPTNNILDILLPECITSYTIYRDGTIYTYYSDENQLKFKHIYIFVNENSASSSELLLLGLKKYLNNVTVIGSPTVGKGVGQVVFENKQKNIFCF